MQVLQSFAARLHELPFALPARPGAAVVVPSGQQTLDVLAAGSSDAASGAAGAPGMVVTPAGAMAFPMSASPRPLTLAPAENRQQVREDEGGEREAGGESAQSDGNALLRRPPAAAQVSGATSGRAESGGLARALPPPLFPYIHARPIAIVPVLAPPIALAFHLRLVCASSQDHSLRHPLACPPADGPRLR